MLSKVRKNPYRYLGVYSNSPAKNRVANTNRVTAYVKVGKHVEFPSDMGYLMGALERDLKGVNEANSSITLPLDQLKYALFWFIDASAIDSMALKYLQSENKEKAIELLEKKETFSSLINRATIAFIDNDFAEGISCITRVIHNDEYRLDFISTICGGSFRITESELARIFIDSLLEEISAGELRQLFIDNGESVDDDEVLDNLAVAEPTSVIKAAIDKAKSIANDDADAQLQAGNSLMRNTKKSLEMLKDILGIDDMRYQMIVDDLAKQILQCGINYYNNSSDDDDVSVEKALKLQQYALNIAVGKMTKDRCKQNVEILEERKKSLPPPEVKDDVNAIMLELSNFKNKAKSISNAKVLLRNTKPHLQSMKNKLGAFNAAYLKISTIVVDSALNNLITVVNNAQSNTPKTAAAFVALHSVIKEAWEVTVIMESFDINADYRSRFDTNKHTLKNLYDQLNEIISITSSPRMNSSSQNSNSKEETNWGCWLVGAIAFMLLLLL